MPLQLSGQITIQNLITECGGTGKLSEYYRGGALVPDRAENSSVPTSGVIRLSNFYGCNCMPGGGGGGGGTPGGGSVSVYAYMPLQTTKLAKDLTIGDELLLLDSTDNSKTMIGSVVSNRVSTQKLVTLVSASGIRLTCSDNTPLTLEDKSSINSTEAKGHKLPVEDENGFRWEEIVDVLDAGVGEVATIYCLNQCYGAGDEPGKYIWTHNETNGKN